MRQRKRGNVSSVTLQTIHSDVHRNFFASVEVLKESPDFSSYVDAIDAFFNFDFIESTSFKNVEVPVHLDLATWSDSLLSSHIQTMSDFMSIIEDRDGCYERFIATSQFLVAFSDSENMYAKLICETDDICNGNPNIDELCRRDDENNMQKKENIEEFHDIIQWFNENRDAPNHERMAKLVAVWICKRSISMYSESSEKLACALRKLEDNSLVERVVLNLMKDENLFQQLVQRRHVFDMLQNRFDLMNNEKTVHTESFFRNCRAHWKSLSPTPGFKGVDFQLFDKVQQVSIVCGKGEHNGRLLSDLPHIKGLPSKQVDVFTCDNGFQAKLKRYFEDGNATLKKWRSFVDNEYVPGSAIFFHPTLVGPNVPTESMKPSYLAFVQRSPAHCYDRNLITEQGLSLQFLLLTFDHTEKEWFLGTQEKLESKNSTQRRRLILAKDQAVLATQLPGKKNIDTNYVNEIYYGARMVIPDVDDGRLII